MIKFTLAFSRVSIFDSDFSTEYFQEFDISTVKISRVLFFQRFRFFQEFFQGLHFQEFSRLKFQVMRYFQVFSRVEITMFSFDSKIEFSTVGFFSRV